MALSEELAAALDRVEEIGWTESDVVAFLRAVRGTGMPVAQVIALLGSVAAQYPPDGPRSGVAD